ncbi:hypothetical protein HDU91_004492 [Kappamyces sp. JEL0680]|nr:hypothetical protein HDU91_004492 [Kappamyces sp. JEL0680]
MQLRNDLRYSQDALKVKESMLDDQNETIKTLKMNLDNKTREFQAVSKELDNARDAFEEQEEKEHLSLKTLKQDVGGPDADTQLETLEANEQHYKAIAQEYKIERDQLREQYALVQAKLEERNASIEKIEHEVLKVQQHFQSKQDLLEKTHKQEIQSIILQHESDKQKADFYIKEKESLISKLKQTQSQLLLVSKQRNDLETELKFVVGQLDVERMRSSQKMAKLKAALE